MYKRVLHDELDFHQAPDHFDNDARVLLRGMLQRDPLFRITIPRIKRMPYFQQISWDFIREKRYNPPFVPTLNPLDPTDTSYFEDAFLMMPPQVKGDPNDDPGAGRDPPEGKAQDPVDKDGRDVFDGCERFCSSSVSVRLADSSNPSFADSYYGGRDSASIHDHDDDDDDDRETDAFAGFGVYPDGAELDQAGQPPPLSTREDVVTGSDEAALCNGTPETVKDSSSVRERPDSRSEEIDDEDDIPQLGSPYPELILGHGRITSLQPSDSMNPQLLSAKLLQHRAPAAEAGPPELVRQQAERAESKAVGPGLSTVTLADVHEQSTAPQQADVTGAFDALTTSHLDDGVADDADDWVALETGPTVASVRNGGREATLWDRGFRDRYRMTLAPIGSPLRPPRRSGRSTQASRAGSTSSAISSSRMSPASTPDPPASPRPLGLIRRFTSPRQSLNSAVVRSHEGSLDSGSPRPNAARTSARLGGKTSKTSLSPSGTSTVDRASSTGGDSRKASPIHRLAKSASGFIEKF